MFSKDLPCRQVKNRACWERVKIGIQEVSLFLYSGGDDVPQLCEAGEEEFLEIMALVGMASKPLHVRRLQKALQEWVANPGNSLIKPLLNYPKILAFPKQALVFMCLQYKSYENTVGKGEIAHNEHFLLFLHHFYPIKDTIMILSTFIISSANAFNLVQSIKLSFGKA